MAKLQIPLPPLEIQHEIVAAIESEQKMVNGSRDLIRICEEKIKKVIDRVWEGQSMDDAQKIFEYHPISFKNPTDRDYINFL